MGINNIWFWDTNVCMHACMQASKQKPLPGGEPTSGKRKSISFWQPVRTGNQEAPKWTNKVTAINMVDALQKILQHLHPFSPLPPHCSSEKALCSKTNSHLDATAELVMQLLRLPRYEEILAVSWRKNKWSLLVQLHPTWFICWPKFKERSGPERPLLPLRATAQTRAASECKDATTACLHYYLSPLGYSILEKELISHSAFHVGILPPL